MDKRATGDLASRLGQVIWWGLKATDHAPLRRMCELAAVCAIVGEPTAVSPGLDHYSAEQSLGHRLDYGTRSFDALPDTERAKIADLIAAQAAGGPVTLVTHAAHRLAATIALSTPGVTLLGNPASLEQMFNQKPWVEQQLSARGVPVLPWRHVRTATAHGFDLSFPVVVRPPTGTGGAGMSVVTSASELAAVLAPFGAADLVSVAPYLDGALSVNVTACVHADGTVQAHPMSLQIIGADSCTDRSFGYCGNDFGRISDLLSIAKVRHVDGLVTAVGDWMYRYGFRGAFGLDLMVLDDQALVTEVNPRFQGSSHMGAVLMRQADMEDAYEQHLRAHLGMPPRHRVRPLTEIVAAQRPLSQVLSYNVDVPVGGNAASAPDEASATVEFTPEPGLTMDRHALLFRYTCDRVVLDHAGRALLPEMSRQLHHLRAEATDPRLSALSAL